MLKALGEPEQSCNGYYNIGSVGYISRIERLVISIYVGNGGIFPFNYCVQMLLEGCSKCTNHHAKKVMIIILKTLTQTDRQICGQQSLLYYSLLRVSLRLAPITHWPWRGLELKMINFVEND